MGTLVTGNIALVWTLAVWRLHVILSLPRAANNMWAFTWLAYFRFQSWIYHDKNIMVLYLALNIVLCIQNSKFYGNFYIWYILVWMKFDCIVWLWKWLNATKWNKKSSWPTSNYCYFCHYDHILMSFTCFTYWCLWHVLLSDVFHMFYLLMSVLPTAPMSPLPLGVYNMFYPLPQWVPYLWVPLVLPQSDSSSVYS